MYYGKDYAEAWKCKTIYSCYQNSRWAWFEPYVPVAVAKFAGPAAAGSWLGSSLLPAMLAYMMVKGVGWYDWGNNGLNNHKKCLNGLDKWIQTR